MVDLGDDAGAAPDEVAGLEPLEERDALVVAHHLEADAVGDAIVRVVHPERAAAGRRWVERRAGAGHAEQWRLLEGGPIKRGKSRWIFGAMVDRY